MRAAAETVANVLFLLGWNAPRRSHELVHPKGLGATATNRDMHISL
jgi:hypothetical protein